MTVHDINTGKLVDGELLSTMEAAAVLGVHPRTIERWSREGKIPVAGKTAGGHRRYKREELLDCFNATA